MRSESSSSLNPEAVLRIAARASGDSKITVHADRLRVEIHGAPPLNVAFGEVGLKDSGLGGVGGGT